MVQSLLFWLLYGKICKQEIAISVFENRVVWINGPFPANKHDLTIFQEELKKKIPPSRRAIGDRAYAHAPE
jgi:hypothetical protein